MLTGLGVLVGLLLAAAQVVLALMSELRARRAVPVGAGPVTVVNISWEVKQASAARHGGAGGREGLLDDPWTRLVLLLLATGLALSGYLRYRATILATLFVMALVGILALAVRVRFVEQRGLAAGRAWVWSWFSELVSLLALSGLAGYLLVRDNPWVPYRQMRERVREMGWSTLLGRSAPNLFLLWEMVAVLVLFVVLAFTVALGAGSAVALYQTASHRRLSRLGEFGGYRSRADLALRPVIIIGALVGVAVLISPWWVKSMLDFTTFRPPGSP